MGVETIGGGGGYSGAHKRRGDRSHADDEFELHTKASDEHQVVTRVQAAAAARSRVTSGDHSSTEAVDALQSDTNSEEIILQKMEPAARGIMISRDVSVRYTPK
jgi:hypothetical protein